MMQNEPQKQREDIEPRPDQKYEKREEAYPEQREVQKEEPRVEGEENVRELLERKAEEMEVTPDIKEDIRTHVASAKTSGDGQATVQRLIQVVRAKGVPFGIKVAKEMDDPYVLDLLHDTLAKDNLYKQYLE